MRKFVNASPASEEALIKNLEEALILSHAKLEGLKKRKHIFLFFITH